MLAGCALPAETRFAVVSATSSSERGWNVVTTFVDLFCGSGGLTLGLRKAGWTALAAVDRSPDAVATYRLNFPDHQCLEEQIEALSAQLLADRLPERPDWVVGGPPCQGFSTVGRRERDDPRNRLVEEFHRVVGLVRPRGFLIENVTGLRDMQFVDEIVALFEPLGYMVTPFVLAAANYGVSATAAHLLCRRP